MKSVLAIFAVVAAVLVGLFAGTTARAQNYPWCAHYDKGDDGMNCGFTSFQQCLTDVSGIGGFCAQNNTYVPPNRTAPHQAVKRRARKSS